MEESASAIGEDDSRKLVQEKRQTDDRRGSEEDGIDSGERRQDDRRKMMFGVIFTMASSLVELEEWLDANCEGTWNVALDDLDDSLVTKTVKIMFELESDKLSFKAEYSR